MGREHGLTKVWSPKGRLRWQTEYELGIQTARKWWNRAGQAMNESSIDPDDPKFAELQKRRSQEDRRIQQMEAALRKARFTPAEE
jgi:hypothetical protein